VSAALPPLANVPGATTGSIYDIGYRNYDGPRLGRRHAIRSLFSNTLGSTYGIGRGTRSKLVPVTLAFLACIPAVAIIAAQALVRQFPGGDQALPAVLPIRYDTYASTIGIFVILFCAAQAPDVFGRDQRYSLLALYFSRALRRTDYAVARMAGFMVAIFILQMLPQVLLFLGQVLLATDIVKGASNDLPKMAEAAGQAVVTAALLGGLSMTISAFTPRRAYAVAGIIALFIIPSIVVGIVVGLGSVDLGRWLILLSPTSVLDGTNGILFDVPRFAQVGRVSFDVPDAAYVAAAAIGILGSIAITIRRFQRISA
jgi:ABC-2 type transport system permease protein